MDRLNDSFGSTTSVYRLNDIFNSTTTAAYDWTNDSVFDAAQTLREVYIWILFVLGFPGNVASLITILSMRVTTATVYVALLAVADGVTLVVKLLFHQLSTYDVLPVPFTGTTCKALTMIVEMSSCYANWALVLVCLERFISVRFPMKKHVFFTRRRALISAAALYGALFLCFAHLLYSKNYCIRANDFYDNAWPWIQSALYFFIPFVAVAVLTVLIIVCLRQYRRARQAMMHNTGREDKSGTEKAISIMLVSAAITFLALALPTCVFFLISDATMDDWGFTIGDKYLFYQVTTFLADATHAVNFYVYFFSAAKFRHRFLELTRQLCPCQRAGVATNGVSTVESTQYTNLAQSKENMLASTAV